ncbi:DUF3631 domain-containing protein [Cupriavidus necator]
MNAPQMHDRDLHKALAQACADVGIEYKDIPADGQWHRTDVLDDCSGKGDAAIKVFSDGAGGIVFNWKGQTQVFFADAGRKLSDAERADRKRLADAARAEAEAERQKQASRAALQVMAVTQAATKATADHPYLTRKGIAPAGPLYEMVVERLAELIGYNPKANGEPLSGRILVAQVSINGKPSTLEMIDERGRKSALYGGAKAGGYWCTNELPKTDDGPTVLICEGVATAISAYEATGHTALAALSCGNLERVAQTMRAKYPAGEIVICADLGNGQTDAERAAQAVGGRVALPVFAGSPEIEGKVPTDFNDMHALAGLDAVRICIEGAAAPGNLTNASIGEPETDEQAVARLAALTPFQYDRVRNTEAKRMGVQVSTLDRKVKNWRGNAAAADTAPFEDVEPHPEPVDGAVLLSDIASTIRRFVVCDPEAVVATALWCMAAWLVDQVSVCPILLINAPEKACGKTQLLTVTGNLVPKPAQAAGISPSVLFRMIEKYQPTLLVDEIETVLTREAEELRGLMNAGHTRDSAFVWRSVAVGDDFEPKRFNVFGFKAIAGINADKLAETITSRAIVATLRKKRPEESVERLRHAEPGLFDNLRAKLARWAEDNAEAIRLARPDLPDALGDRDQDNWEPLLAVADLVGGSWPKYARSVALKLSGREQAQSTGSELLADIQEVFESKRVERISSVDLVAALCKDEERPWATWNRGKQITPRQLARKLDEYGIKSKTLRIGLEVCKGFAKDAFADAFSRYLPQSAESSVTRLQPNAHAGFSVTESSHVTATGDSSVTPNLAPAKACNPVTHKDGNLGCGTGDDIADDAGSVEV